MNLEKYYRDENIKYRKLRYMVLPNEAKDILNWLFERFGLNKIPIKFQNRVTWKGEEVVAVFLHPEIHYKLQFRFEKEDLEALTVLHEFTHYYVYTLYEYGNYP